MQQDYKPNAGEHPITPPLALIDQWWDEAKQNAKYDEPIGPLVANQAAQWGADMELEACLKWMGSFCATWTCGRRPEDVLRAARRPKPPSLKEQALALLEVEHGLNVEDLDLLRRALEQLPDAL
jgi:hypothetical protein